MQLDSFTNKSNLVSAVLPVLSRATALTMPKKIDETADEPNKEVLERGKRFGAWFRAAVERSGKSIPAIADEMGVSRQQLYAYRNDCIAPDRRFRKPSEGMIRKIAAVTSAIEADGLRSMGYDAGTSPAVAAPLAQLPPDAQQMLARFVQMVKETDANINGRIVREVTPASARVLDAFEGLPEAEQESFLESINTYKASRIRQAGNTNIIGKRPVDDDEVVRMPIEEEYED